MTESDSVDSQPSSEGSSPAPEVTPAQETAPVSSPSLEDQLAAAKKEAMENYNRYLRAVADLENFRKRAVREKDELRQYAAGRVLEDLIPVLDNLGLGLAAAKLPNADTKTVVNGIEMVISQLKNALGINGLKEINPVGVAFDPHQHQAISHLPHAEIPSEHVMTVVRTGYSLNGRLLRPASVVVSSGPAGADEKETPAS